MATKLTLTLDKKIIKAAKEYARNNDISLSGIVEMYFKTLSSEADVYDISPITRELSGMVRFSTKKTDKELLGEALNKKFL